MVGVPGKSKGCSTCRRRKVKCDEAQPLCQRCRRANLECEGYERFPVFIDRTTSGLRRRLPLEEAKPTAQDFELSRSQESASNTTPSVLSFQSPALETLLFVSWFQERFAFAPPCRKALKNPPNWLLHVIALPTAHNVLQSGLLATSIAYFAKVHASRPMIEEGRRLYARTLSLLNTALSHKTLVFKDDVLATVGLMSLYELFDTNLECKNGWLSHILGVLNLVEIRGPKRHRETMPRTILEHFRYLLMMQQLTDRKGSVLSTHSWIEIPWEGIEKSDDQRIFDYGLKLSSIFERSDQVQVLDTNGQQLVSLLRDCSELVDGIQYQRDVIDSRLCDLESESEPIQSLPKHPAPLFLSVTALGIQLGACVTGCDAFQRLTDISAISPTNQEADFELLYHQFKISSLILNQQRKPLANEIIDTVLLSLQGGRIAGTVAVRLIFSLQLAMQQFEPSELGYHQSLSLIERLRVQTPSFEPPLEPGKS